jgi:tRNA pseudouridine32 synthase/23S rRNA pseudouridine746 synthase
MRPAKHPLPVRAGVAPSYLWVPEGKWSCLLEFLVIHFSDVPKDTWLSRFERREVVDLDGKILTPDSPCLRGMCLFYYREVENEAHIPFAEQILYRDEHILVADKPHFLPVTPGGQFLHETLLVRLKKKLHCDVLTPIHRLDRETAGVIIFSCNEKSRGAYQRLFQQRSIKKNYEALAAPRPDLSFPLIRRSRIIEAERFFVMREADGEPNSETLISVLRKQENAWLYALQPVSGRKHQLRVHMAALGMPILNDTFYPYAQPPQAADFTKPLKLLARSIGFQDPLSGEYRSFSSIQNLA